jgi:hypothetical protein
LGFITLNSLIGLGIALLLAQLLNSAGWILFPALVVNAFVGSGLAMALLIFYRTHYLASDAEFVR